MSRRGRSLAIQYGEELPAFTGKSEAEQYYYGSRDRHLAILSEVAVKQQIFYPDYSPQSLKFLEQWYFHLYETDSFHLAGIHREEFEICMAMYFGETAVQNEHADWVVEPYFLASNKYDLGVCKGFVTVKLFRFTDHFLEPNNKKRESLFRCYQKYFGHSRQTELDKELISLLRQKKAISAIAFYQERKQCSLEEAKRYIDTL
jgi:hypothetical protein